MEYNELLLSKKDEVFESVRDSGLDLFRFRWHTASSIGTNDLIVSKLEYDGGPFFYLFDFLRGKPYSVFSPGEDVVIERQNPGNWPYQRGYFRGWLRYLQRELTAPDLWSALSRYQLPEGEIANTEFGNELFTPSEADHIRVALNQTRQEMIGRFDLSAEQIVLLDQKLDYLIASSKRQTRRDWAHLCIAVVFTIAVGLGLDQTDALVVWESVKSSVTSFGGLLLK